MDSNGLRSFGVNYRAGLYAWRLPTDPAAPEGAKAIAVEPSTAHQVIAVRLVSRVGGLTLAETRTATAEVALEPAMAIDAAGNTIRWDREKQQLVSVSHLATTHPELEAVALLLPDAAQPVSDLAIGDDSVLYVAGGGTLWLVDLRARFETTSLPIAGFTPQKLTAMPNGGVLALDVTSGRIARVTGLPKFTTGVDPVRDRDDRFDAVESNPNAPHANVLAARFDAGEKAIGIACNGEGAAIVLTLNVASGGASIRLLKNDGALATAVGLAGPRFPHTVGWLDDAHLAIVTLGVIAEAGRPPRDPGVFAYEFPQALRKRLAAPQTALRNDGIDPLQPLGDYYPLAEWTSGPFLNGLPGGRLHYPRADMRSPATPVARISAAARCAYGIVANFPDDRVPGARIQSAVGSIDTRDPSTVWHRVYAEACVPTGSAMIVWLAAADAGAPRFEPNAPTSRGGWHAHLIGDRSALPADVAAALPDDTPRAAWVRDASEVPFGESLLGCDREVHHTGLFTALIQRAGFSVRALRGACMWAVVEMFGDSRASPELVALRVYAGRVSYRDRYLPALYHETAFGEEADVRGRATGPDFLERFIHLFEGTATGIEDRIAASWIATDPHACPPDALPWLGSWIGIALDAGTPPARARLMIANGPRLAQRHGTLEGMQLALDIATDGGVTKGRIVVVENWRLRRTLATILGANLADVNDPLTAGIAQSGNSFVGDSLFLGDENAKTFLALFRDLRTDPNATSFEAKRQKEERDAAIHALYDGLAWRVTVLVHEEAAEDELRSIRRLAETGAPAHVIVRVATAKYPFMVGVASLIGAHTFLRAPEPAQPVRVEASQLGYVDTLQGLGSLDANGGGLDEVLTPAVKIDPLPVARIRASRTDVGAQEPFELNGDGSTAAPGRTIDLYRWTHQPPD